MNLEEILKECQVYADPNRLRIFCPICGNHNFTSAKIDRENQKIDCFCGSCGISFVIYGEKERKVGESVITVTEKFLEEIRKRKKDRGGER